MEINPNKGASAPIASDSTQQPIAQPKMVKTASNLTKLLMEQEPQSSEGSAVPIPQQPIPPQSTQAVGDESLDVDPMDPVLLNAFMPTREAITLVGKKSGSIGESKVPKNT